MSSGQQVCLLPQHSAMGPVCEVTEPDRPKSPTPSELSNCCVVWQAIQSPGFLCNTQTHCGWFQNERYVGKKAQQTYTGH